VTDIWPAAKRSEVMSRIRSRATKPELIVRLLLHRSGVSYSLRRKDLPGKPDIVKLFGNTRPASFAQAGG
jgi:DNA mismatch endonuclease, patch repair protein